MGSVTGRRTSGTYPRFRAPASSVTTIKLLVGFGRPLIFVKICQCRHIRNHCCGAAPPAYRCVANSRIIATGIGKEGYIPSD